MTLPGLEQLEEAARVVTSAMRPTAEICWPTLSARCGVEVWVKHENHTPIGSFKVRGGLVYVDDLLRVGSAPAGIVAATRGNHGRSIAFAARRRGLRATVVVPHGNSVETNAAMRAFGAELIEHGRDFQDALEHASEAPENASSPWSLPFMIRSSGVLPLTGLSSCAPLAVWTRCMCR